MSSCHPIWKQDRESFEDVSKKFTFYILCRFLLSHPRRKVRLIENLQFKNGQTGNWSSENSPHKYIYMRQFSLRRLFVCDQWRGGSPIHFDSCLNLCMGKQQASLHNSKRCVPTLAAHKSDLIYR